MGGASSQHDISTPPKPLQNSRVLDIDPRSPSAEISRTPIVVDKTPVSALDPRSPTVGIIRTPLPQGPAQQDLDTAMEPVDLPLIDPQPDDIDLEEQVQGSVSTEDKDVLMDPLGVTDIHCLSLDDFPSCESTRLVPNDDPQGLIVETEKLRVKKKKQRATQPKELFPNKRGEMRDVTRSPLSTRNIEMNSPLKIVQRKQTNKIDKARTCGSESLTARFIVKDKENM